MHFSNGSTVACSKKKIIPKWKPRKTYFRSKIRLIRSQFVRTQIKMFLSSSQNNLKILLLHQNFRDYDKKRLT